MGPTTCEEDFKVGCEVSWAADEEMSLARLTTGSLGLWRMWNVTSLKGKDLDLVCWVKQ